MNKGDEDMATVCPTRAPAMISSRPLELAALDTAPSCARGHVTALLRETGLGHLEESAALIVSELVTNAIRAARADCPENPVVSCRLCLSGTAVRVEVWDPSQRMPQEQDADGDSEGGRGLLLINALTDGRWGAVPASKGGKIVWAQLPGERRADIRRLALKIFGES